MWMPMRLIKAFLIWSTELCEQKLALPDTGRS